MAATNKMEDDSPSSGFEEFSDALSYIPEDGVFNLEVVLRGFKDSRGDSKEILLDGYLKAYTELNKFFQILGHVFNFVANDVQSKINILQGYCNGECGDKYYSIQSMIQYEREADLLTSKKRPSGARTLLRLHRALEFLSGFLAELHKASDGAKLGSITSEVYSRTLAKFHGWVLAKTVSTVLFLMPTKQTLIDKVTAGDADLRSHNEALMPQVIEAANSVYTHTEKLYIEFDILDLP